MTSCPMRGMCIAPQLVPAQTCATRTQHELFSSFPPSRSQWNCTLTRPYLSVQISSPDLPTTTAVWGPSTRGFFALGNGRNWTPESIAPNSQENVGADPPPENWLAPTSEVVVQVMRYSRFWLSRG